MLAAALTTAPAVAATAVAFEVQTGGLPLSARSTALLEERLTAGRDAARPDRLPPDRGPATRVNPMGFGPVSPGALSADERMMRFMLGEPRSPALPERELGNAGPVQRKRH
ncbi:hypothetical protein TSO352_09830 [Azospirillum sp. TSO35-2]|nr:hypothetical protein TSO352_09830 [Azospirillum sp. TSO35-2]